MRQDKPRELHNVCKTNKKGSPVAKLSKVDIAILTVLRDDAKLTNEQVGQRVGRSGSAVSRRVAELEKDGTIAGYRADIDARKAGLLTVIYKLVNLHGHSRDLTDPFEATLESWPNVVEWCRLEGHWDYLLKFLVTDTVQGDQLHDRLLALSMVKSAQGLRVLDRPRTKPLPLDGLA